MKTASSTDLLSNDNDRFQFTPSSDIYGKHKKCLQPIQHTQALKIQIVRLFFFIANDPASLGQCFMRDSNPQPTWS